MQYKTHIELKDYLEIIYRRVWIIIQSVIIFALTVGIYNFFLKPVYKTSATLIIRRPVSSISTPIFFQLDLIGGINQKSTYLNLLRSQYIVRKAVERITSDPKLQRQIASNVRIEDVPDTKLIKVSLYGHDPEKITKWVNQIAQFIVEYNYALNSSAIDRTSKFIEKQLETTEKNLEEIENKIKNFKEKIGLVELGKTFGHITQEMINLEAKINENNLQIRKLDLLIKEYRKQLSKQKETLENSVNISANPEYEKYKYLIGQKRMEMIGLEAVYGKKHPVYKKAKAELDFLQNQMSLLIRSELKSVTKEKNPYYLELTSKLMEAKIEKEILLDQNKQIEKRLKKEEEKLKSLPEKQLQYERLLRDKKVTEKIYQLIKQKYSETQIAQSAKEKILDLASPATVPSSYIRPRKLVNTVFSAVAGFFVGLVLVFVLEFFDHTLKSPVEVKENFPYDLIGVIPYIDISKKKNPEKNVIINPYLIMGYDPRSKESENIRILRTNILYSTRNSEYNLKSILITNSTKGEGKSFIASNIAISLADIGYRVLLVDADLRRAKLYLYFGVLNTEGLTNILLGDEIEDKIQTTIFDNLYLITSGPLPPNPGELIASPYFDNFLEWAEDNFDFIIIDSPPVTAVTDAQVIAAKVDGVIYLVTLYSDEASQVKTGLDLIEKVGGKILGLVCNKVRESAFYKVYYGYYQNNKT